MSFFKDNRRELHIFATLHFYALNYQLLIMVGQIGPRPLMKRVNSKTMMQKLILSVFLKKFLHHFVNFVKFSSLKAQRY